MIEQRAVRVLPSAAFLTTAVAVAWIVCFWPARSYNPDSGILWMSFAAISCLVPGWIVVFLSGLAIFPSELAAMLVQTMIRLFVVGGVAVAVRTTRPEIHFIDFYLWLVAFYLLTMAVEVWMLRKSLAVHSKEHAQSSD